MVTGSIIGTMLPESFLKSRCLSHLEACWLQQLQEASLTQDYQRIPWTQDPGSSQYLLPSVAPGVFRKSRILPCYKVLGRVLWNMAPRSPSHLFASAAPGSSHSFRWFLQLWTMVPPYFLLVPMAPSGSCGSRLQIIPHKTNVGGPQAPDWYLEVLVTYLS